MRDMKQVFMYGIKKYTEIGVVLERNQMFWDDAPGGRGGQGEEVKIVLEYGTYIRLMGVKIVLEYGT